MASTRLLGIANPTPSLPPDLLRINVFMPTTWLRLSESAKFRNGKAVRSTLITATSVCRSFPMSLALTRRPPTPEAARFSLTCSCRAPSTTWALVTIYPSAETMIPDPEPLCCKATSPPRSSVKEELKIWTTAGSTCLAMLCNDALSCSREVGAGVWASPVFVVGVDWEKASKCKTPRAKSDRERILIMRILLKSRQRTAAGQHSALSRARHASSHRKKGRTPAGRDHASSVTFPVAWPTQVSTYPRAFDSGSSPFSAVIWTSPANSLVLQVPH